MPKKKKIKEWGEETEKDIPDLLDETSEIESPDNLSDGDDLDAVPDIDDSPVSKVDDDISDF